jgi:hypothetical protein
MNCHYCCPNHHNLENNIRSKDFLYICDICKTELQGNQIMYSCHNCDFDVCKKCSLKPYSIGFRGLLAKHNLLNAFEKNPSTIKTLYRDLISAEIYHTAQKWDNSVSKIK